MPRFRLALSFVRQPLPLAALALLLLLPVRAAAQNGTVTGTVTDAGTGAPIAGISVNVVLMNGGFVAAAFTNASGVYSISVPPGALYYITTDLGPGGYLVEAHPDVQCLSGFCSSTDLREAEPFSMVPGGSVTGRDLSLARGGTIYGTVSGPSGGVQGVSVSAVVRFGNTTYTRSSSTTAGGTFSIIGLYPGSYVLMTTFNTAGLRNEIFDNVACVGSCSQANALAMGTPIVVDPGATVTGRNFNLETGGSVSGTVMNTGTGLPLANVTVNAYTKVGDVAVFGGSAFTNASGEYTIRGLAAGSYALYTSSSATTNEYFGDVLCLNFCSSTTSVDAATLVPVALGATVPGINFGLDPGLTLSGTVTNEATGAGIVNVQVIAWMRVGQSFSGRSAFTNGSGNYTISGLLAGTYVLSTSVGGFTNEVFDNITCPTTGCSTTALLASGTPVNVTSSTVNTGKNFALQPLTAAGTGTLTGTVVDAASGLPIGGMSVTYYRLSGSTIQASFTANSNVSGVYTATTDAASYWVATSGFHPYRNEAFDNIPCPGNCGSPPNTSVVVPVAAGATATADFELSAGDGFSGVVTSAATGLPLAGVTVNAYQVSSGLFAGSFTTSVRGQFVLRGLANGEYVAYTSNGQGYFDEIHSNLRCSFSCSASTALASGTRISISGAAAAAGADLAELVTGVDFALDTRTQVPGAPSNFRIATTAGTGVFSWNAPSLSSGGAPTSYLLEAGGSPGTTFITLPIPGTGTTFTVPGVPPGTYYVRVKGVNANGAGAASNEVVLVVGAGGNGLPAVPTGLSAFMAGNRITINWTPGLGFGPVSGYVVEAGSTSGASNIATINVPTATFTFTGVPPGFYFLRVRARNAAGVSAPSTEVMLVVGNVPAPPSAPSLSHSVSGSTATFTWSAPNFGPVTGYIVEAGSAPGLSNLAVVTIGNVLTQSFAGVPPGTYYVRIRALNAQGASIASNERTVIVSP
jgi:5-hydroxyisourate hydrolase-like protein (transthyretin family)